MIQDQRYHSNTNLHRHRHHLALQISDGLRMTQHGEEMDGKRSRSPCLHNKQNKRKLFLFTKNGKYLHKIDCQLAGQWSLTQYNILQKLFIMKETS